MTTLFNVAPHKLVKSQKTKKPLSVKVDSEPKWCLEAPPALPEDEKQTLDVSKIEELYVKAMDVFLREGKRQGSKHSFEQEIVRKGTTSDKIAALSMIIIENPMMKLFFVDKLLELCESKNSRAADLATRATVDLFLNNLMPSRGLKHFKDQNLPALVKLREKEVPKEHKKEEKEKNDQYLLYWYFEEQLKKRFKKLVDILIERSKSSIEATRTNALRDMRVVILKTGEERDNLLRQMISKFGDSVPLVAGKALNYLETLVNSFQSEEHTNPYFCKDVDRFMVVREAANFLYNPKEDPKAKNYAATFLNRIELAKDVDKKLAQELIEVYMKTCKIHFKEANTHLMGSILSGIYRAFPVAELPPKYLLGYVETFLKIARVSSFNIAVDAARVLFAVVQSSQDPTTADKFYTLVYEMLLNRGIRTHLSRVPQFFSTVFQAVLLDTNQVRQRAFLKRIMQTAFYAPAAYACASLLMEGAAFSQDKSLTQCLQQSEQLNLKMIEDNDEEVFTDADKKSSSTKAVLDDSDEEEDKEETQKTPSNVYDPHHPYPQDSKADRTGLWEMVAMSKYYHPTARMFAENILKGVKSRLYDGNPIEDFSLTGFLDKFMYKNPKKKKIVVDPVSKRLKKGSQRLLVNSSEFKELPEALVRSDEKFFHKYMKQREQHKKKEEEHKSKLTPAQEERQNRVQKVKEDLTMKEHEEDAQSDTSSLYSYSQLDDVINRDYELDDTMADELLLRYASDDEDINEENEEPKKSKKKEKSVAREGTRFGYDVTSGDLEESAKPRQDEIATLLEEDEDEIRKEATSFDDEDTTVPLEANKQRKKPKQKTPQANKHAGKKRPRQANNKSGGKKRKQTR